MGLGVSECVCARARERESGVCVCVGERVPQRVSDFGVTLEPFRTFRVLNTNIYAAVFLHGRSAKHNTLG